MIIYQIFTRLFGNRNLTHKPWGTIAENGCGKMNDIDIRTLRHIRDLGVSHVWYTGVIRHASLTDYSQYGIPVQHPKVVKGLRGVMMNLYLSAAEYDYHTLLKVAEMAGLAGIIGFPVQAFLICL